MRYVAAYLLAILGGNENPDVASLKKILASVGIDCEEAKAKKVIDSLKGKKVEELIAKGKEKLSSMPSGGAVAVTAAPAAAAPAAGGKPAEEKKEEKKKEEKKEESDDEDMGFGLFD